MFVFQCLYWPIKGIMSNIFLWNLSTILKEWSVMFNQFGVIIKIKRGHGTPMDLVTELSKIVFWEPNTSFPFNLIFYLYLWPTNLIGIQHIVLCWHTFEPSFVKIHPLCKSYGTDMILQRYVIPIYPLKLSLTGLLKGSLCDQKNSLKWYRNLKN